MTTYLVECYWPGVDQHTLDQTVERLSSTPRELRGRVEWVNAVLVPDDEIVLCLADGPSVEAVRTSAQRAGLPAERVVPCLHVIAQPTNSQGGQPRSSRQRRRSR
jgi:hypothetical protein